MNTPPVDPAVQAVLKSAVVHGLADNTRWPSAPLEPRQFRGLLQHSADHRVLGAVAEAIADDALAVTPEQFYELSARHTGALTHALRIEQMLLLAGQQFDDAGIDFRLLKGPALAHLVYRDPAWRVFADVDLLIRANRFDEAVAVTIGKIGGEQPVPELRPGFDHEFGKDSMVRIGRIEVDLHRTFVAGPFGLTMDPNELFEHSTKLMIGNRRLSALGAHHQFLHACYNTALGDFPVRLCSVRDLLLCRQHLPLDLDQVVRTAERWHGLGVIQRAAQLVVDIAGADIGSDFVELASLPVPRREAWLMRSYLTSARSYSRPLASLVVIAGVRPRLRYARALIAPSEEYLRSRGWSERSHLSRAIGRLRNHD